MSKIEIALQWMLDTANDNSHGYDQIYRWGEKGDYDCSSAIITACEYAGIPLKSNGATYTGNMKPVALALGCFKDVTSQVNLSTGAGLQKGDILLNTTHHVAMYCGNGQLVHASINEKGKATGGTPGDQTGKEFCIRSYYNYPWNCVLRYTGSDAINTAENITVTSLIAHGTANVSTYLNVRSAPSTTAQILGAYAPGDDITITGKTSNGWYRCLIFGGQIGYVSGDYVSNIRNTAPTAETVSITEMNTHGTADVSTYLNVRSAPSTSGVILGAYAPGDDITITGKTSNGWYRCLIFGGQTGYVCGDYVKI
ncbi:MAG: SH3 domain-containing protein [Candidatus Ornithomonoglobus sp.]